MASTSSATPSAMPSDWPPIPHPRYPPTDSPPDWSNLQVIHKHTLPPRASFQLWPSEKAALASILNINEQSKYTRTLTGKWPWGFRLFSTPPEVEREEVLDSPDRYDRIRVPGHWQLQVRTQDEDLNLKDVMMEDEDEDEVIRREDEIRPKIGERWGAPQYTNTNYPWPVDVHDDVANVPRENQTGEYITMFDIPQSWLEAAHKKEGTIRLRFEGVDSAFHVWVNGELVGYSQGSRNASEFDITGVGYGWAEGEELTLQGSKVEGNEGWMRKWEETWKGIGKRQEKKNGDDGFSINLLMVRVYQRCDGSYLEDQDQWWLSGIFRPVTLHWFPKVHVDDFKVETHLSNEYKDGKVFLRLELSEPSDVTVKLLDFVEEGEGGKVIASSAQKAGLKTMFFELRVPSVSLWTAETPYLYTLLISLGSSDTQVIAQRVGFREVLIADGLLKVNGQPITLKGVNRHEHHPEHGRAVPYDFMKRDLFMMKQHGINAIRTSHYLNDHRLYDLADELGLYVIDEADLECHGFGETGSSHPKKFASDNPAWEAAYLDRIKAMVHRDKIHPSIIMWSLGNESFYGRNHRAMYRWVKSYDKTRPVHYEPDAGNDVSDVKSEMYWSVSQCISWLESDEGKNSAKPLILCEFAHAMGNGPGGMREYIDAMHKYPTFQGGFVWEWANHGLLNSTQGVKDVKDGTPYYAYGGDFGDSPNDGHFCLDGLCFSDHTPTPGLLTYAHAIQPVEILEGVSDWFFIRIVNRYDFLTLDHLRCVVRLVGEGYNTEEVVELELSIPRIVPGQSGEIETGIELRTMVHNFKMGKDVNGKSLPCGAPEKGTGPSAGEMWLVVSFRLAESRSWAPAGFEVASGQIQVHNAIPLKDIIERLPMSHDAPWMGYNSKLTDYRTDFFVVRTTKARWVFDHKHGTLVGWTKNLSAEHGAEPWRKQGRLMCNGLGASRREGYPRLSSEDEADDEDESWVEDSSSESAYSHNDFKKAEGQEEWSRNLLATPPLLSFYRALTDNDRSKEGKDWLASRLHQLQHHLVSFSAARCTESKTVIVTVVSRYAPPVLEWSIDTVTTYTFRKASVEIKVKGTPRDLKLPSTLARIGLEFELPGTVQDAEELGLEKVTYWGRGPGEGYRDTKGAGRWGRWYLNAAREVGPILKDESPAKATGTEGQSEKRDSVKREINRLQKRKDQITALFTASPEDIELRKKLYSEPATIETRMEKLKGERRAAKAKLMDSLVTTEKKEDTAPVAIDEILRLKAQTRALKRQRNDLRATWVESGEVATEVGKQEAILDTQIQTLRARRKALELLDPPTSPYPASLGVSTNDCPEADYIGDAGYTAYEVPQDCGNRTDVRWVEFSTSYGRLPSSSYVVNCHDEDVQLRQRKGQSREEDSRQRLSLKASFGDRDGCSFTAHHYRMEDMDKATHHYELADKRQRNVVVRLDWAHHGIGSGSCGRGRGRGRGWRVGSLSMLLCSSERRSRVWRPRLGYWLLI